MGWLQLHAFAPLLCCSQRTVAALNQSSTKQKLHELLIAHEFSQRNQTLPTAALCFQRDASWGCCTGRAPPANAMVQTKERCWLSPNSTLLACYVAKREAVLP